MSDLKVVAQQKAELSYDVFRTVLDIRVIREEMGDGATRDCLEFAFQGDRGPLYSSVAVLIAGDVLDDIKALKNTVDALYNEAHSLRLDEIAKAHGL